MGSLNTGYGLIATLVRDSEVLVRYFDVEPRTYYARTLLAGSGMKDAIAPLVAFCDAGGWKVRTISTPATIVGDLRGRPRGEGSREGANVVTPEQQLLARRGDLIEPRPIPIVTTVESSEVNPHRRRRRGRGPTA